MFELLGNDDAGDDTPTTVPQIIDKRVTGTKRTGPVETPIASGPRRRGPGGNEDAFRDRNAGRDNNRARPTEEAGPGGRGGGRGARVRGGRGSSNSRPFNDRHPRNRAPGSEKQGDQAWGATEGQAELKDEQAGEQIAEAEKTEAATEGETKVEDEPAEPAEPEPKAVTLADYKAELAEKHTSLGEHKIRLANEGSNIDKNWANLKPYSREDDDFMPGNGGKQPRERRAKDKDKETIALDNVYHEPERRPPRVEGRGGRGGRGEYRGGRGRGDGASRPYRGNDTSRPSRGNDTSRPSRGNDTPRPSRGDDAPRPYRGNDAPRGGRGRDTEAPNTESQADFPALGA